jgi:iron complex outermembrane receptor protein
MSFASHAARGRSCAYAIRRRRTRLRLFVLVSIPSLAITAPRNLAAQQRLTPRDTASARDSAAKALNPVVTTATRDARSLRSLPVSISVVDSTTLTRTSTISLSDALRTVPGVVAGNLFGGDDVRLSIRGSGARGGFGVRGVGILLDGVPITEPDGQTRLDQLDLGAARSIEVVRGPGSAIYGGAASGGVVNVITRSGRELQGLTARLTGGGFGPDSINLRKVDLAAGGARGAFDVYVQGSTTRLQGMRVQSRNTMDRANVRLNWVRPNAAPVHATRIGLDVTYSALDMQIPGSLTDSEWRAEPWRADPLNITGAYGRRESRWRVGLRGTQDLGARWGSLDSYLVGTARVIDHPIFRVVDQNTHRVQGGIRHAVQREWSRGWSGRLNSGVDIDRWYGDSRQWTNVGGSALRTTPCVNDRVRNIVSIACTNQYVTLPGAGAYTTADLSRGKTTLTAGTRYDQVAYQIDDRIRPTLSINQTFSQWSPRVALRHEWKPGVSSYVSVARGFEVPTNSELTASPDTTRGLNTELRPSSLVNYEVGTKAFLASRLLLDVAVYRTNVSGEFLSRTVVIPGVAFPRTIYENVGRTRRTGLEVSSTWLVAPSVDVVASYTYARYVMTQFTGTETNAQGQSVAVNYAGKRIPGVPTHRAATELRLRPMARLAASVWGEVQSRIYVDNANTRTGTVYTQVTQTGRPPLIVPVSFAAAPAYGLVHATLTYALPSIHGARAGTSSASMFLTIDNLLDRRYVAAVATNSGNGRFFNPGAGRVINVGVTLTTGGR